MIHPVSLSLHSIAAALLLFATTAPSLAEDTAEIASDLPQVVPIERPTLPDVRADTGTVAGVGADISKPAVPLPGPAIKPSRSQVSLGDHLLMQIGADLQSLGSEIAIDELNRLARMALEIERPDLFRTVMVAEVDGHWAGLSDARTALNMIAWLPDTADNLHPRITAARLAISADELPPIEAQRLWRDLRARVERVGDPDLLIALSTAMIRAESTDLLVDTINRFHTTDRQRAKTFIHLLESHGPSASADISAQLQDALAASRVVRPGASMTFRASPAPFGLSARPTRP